MLLHHVTLNVYIVPLKMGIYTKKKHIFKNPAGSLGSVRMAYGSRWFNGR
jgi:hypothetical protein